MATHMNRLLMIVLAAIATTSCMEDEQTFAETSTEEVEVEEQASLNIINGSEADQGRYPYTVSLQDNIGHFCGASLIAEDIVLSAAHCNGGNYSAVIGRHNLQNNNNGMSIPVAEEIIHPNYDANNTNNDFMILKLSAKVPNVQPLKVNNPSMLPEVGGAVTVMGWGTTENGNLSTRLLEVQVNTITNQQCSQSSGRIDGVMDSYQGLITDSMLCARANNQDSCQGDSGGPLVIRGMDGKGDVQVGVVSWGFGCAERNFPGVYARLSSQYEWIKEMVCAKSDNPPAYFNCNEAKVNRSLMRKLTKVGKIRSPWSSK